VGYLPIPPWYLGGYLLYLPGTMVGIYLPVHVPTIPPWVYLLPTYPAVPVTAHGETERGMTEPWAQLGRKVWVGGFCLS